VHIVRELARMLPGRGLPPPSRHLQAAVPAISTAFEPAKIPISNGQQTLGIALPWGIDGPLIRPSEKSSRSPAMAAFSIQRRNSRPLSALRPTSCIWSGSTSPTTWSRLKYRRTSGVEFGPIDYIKYAKHFGTAGIMIHSPHDIAPVMKKAFDTHGPVIVGVQVDYRVNHKPFEMMKGSLVCADQAHLNGTSPPHPSATGSLTLIGSGRFQKKAAAVTRDGLMRPRRSLAFCVLFVSLVALIEPPLQLAIGPTMHLRGLHLWGRLCGGSLLLRLCERCISQAESHDAGDRECHSDKHWSHNAHIVPPLFVN
jgi:hypothetical protein